jgi:hypothetical protein
MAKEQPKLTDKIFDEVCERIATSSDGLTLICKEFDISRRYFREWKEKTPENTAKYARAKEQQMDFMAEQIIEIADNSSDDTKITEGGNIVQNSEFINRSRLRVDARKWVMSKLAPRKYGERLDLTTNGESINKAPTTIKTPDGKEINLE